MLESTEKGGVRNSIRNCLTVFQNDPLLSGAIAKNLLTERTDIIKPIGYNRTGTAMNHCVTGWHYFSNPRMFPEYGRQKGWEREAPATDTSNGAEKIPEGFVEVTEQMELPF